MIMLFYILLTLAGIICFLCLLQFKLTDRDLYKTGAIVSAFLVYLLLLAILIANNLPELSSKSTGRYEREYMELGGIYLGRYLFYSDYDEPRKDVIIIDYPEGRNLLGAGYSDAVVAGIRNGVNRSGVFRVKEIVHARANNNSVDWLDAKEFDRIVKEHPDAGIIISLVGLPHDLHNLSFWSMENPPKFVFFGGNLENLSEAVRRGVVLAVVSRVPGVSVGGSRPPDPENMEKDFFDRFLLITPENMKMTKQVFPVLFK